MPEDIVKGAEGAVGKKVGPLPLWGWVVGGLVVGGGAYFLFFRGSGSSGGAVLPSSAAGLTGGGGGGGGGTTTTTGITNAQWLQNVVNSVATTTGLPVGQVYLYLTEWLAGTQPQGSTSAQSAFQKVIAAATAAGGQPPTAPTPTNINLNPFSSNSNWLQQALGFLPATVTGSVRQEIVNLFEGTLGPNPVISAQADQAINDLRGILGSEPLPVTYTIGASGGSSAATVVQPLKGSYQQSIDWYNALAGSGHVPTAQEWVNSVSAFTGITNLNAIQSVYDYGKWYRGATNGQRPDEATWYSWLVQAQQGTLKVPGYTRSAQ